MTTAKNVYNWFPKTGTVFREQPKAPEITAVPAGEYLIDRDEKLGWMLMPYATESDALLRVPDSEVDSVMTEIARFQQLEPKYRRLGLMHRRGILLWGVPGGGKTGCVRLVTRDYVKAGNIVLYPESAGECMNGIGLIRNVEPKRPILVVLEDFDISVEGSDNEQAWLEIMDGSHTQDGVVFLCTTNNPEKLPARFTQRPSRFDVIKHVGAPGDAMRRAYFKHVDRDLTNAEVERMVVASVGMSFAHMKELLILTRVFDMPMADAVERMKGNATWKHASDYPIWGAEDEPTLRRVRPSLAGSAGRMANMVRGVVLETPVVMTGTGPELLPDTAEAKSAS